MKNLVPILTALAFAFAVPVVASDLTPEIAERYEQILLRSPGPGTAFDRVIEWYSTEGGGLEALDLRWKEAGEPAIVLRGMLAERQRNPGAAREFYTEALAGGNLAAARLLASLETTEGNFDAAAEAYEVALKEEALPPADRIDLMRDLALLHQRAFAPEKAVEVWKSAVEEFPEEPMVIEEAGEAMLLAGEAGEAKAMFARLVELTDRDPFRRIAAELRLARAAEIAGDHAEATAIYAKALDDTSEGSWIQREVRQRVEDSFRRRDDLPGLLEFYETRLAAHPRDAASRAAASDVLEDLGRSDESLTYLETAVEMAPTDAVLRMAFARRLSRLGKHEEAIAALLPITREEPPAIEAVVFLGDIHWSQYEASGEEAPRENALESWRRIAPEGSSDPARIARLANLLQARGQAELAAAEWERLLQIAPGSIDARQALADFHLEREETDAARDVLAAHIVDGRTAAADYLAVHRAMTRAGFDEDAAAMLERGLGEYAGDYDLLNAAWTVAQKEEDLAAAESILGRLWQNAPNPRFAEDVIARHARFVGMQDEEGKVKAGLVERLGGVDGLEKFESLLLFRMALNDRDQETADLVLATILEEGGLVAARATADHALVFGDPESQIAALRELAVVEPRLATESLSRVARIQSEAGEVDAALATLDELITRSPGDASLYRFYAETARRFGKTDKAIEKLQAAIRTGGPDAASLSLELADLQSSMGQWDAAARTLQTAFEAETQEGRRLNIFRRQIELARQTGRLEDLVASLREKQSREADGGRYGVYLAEIFLLQNDFDAAREELARSLGRNPDDAQAVARLLDLADRGGNQEEGLRLARRLVELEPTSAHRAALVMRLLQTGEREEAEEILEGSRSEILSSPGEWSDVLARLRASGLNELFLSFARDLRARADEHPAAAVELAKILLLEGDAAEAMELLWRVVEQGSPGDEVSAALASHAPSPSQYVRHRMQALAPLYSIRQTTDNSLRVLISSAMNPQHRVVRTGFAHAGRAPASPTIALESIFTLRMMAEASDQLEAFRERVRRLGESSAMERSEALALAFVLADTEWMNRLVEEQAAEANPSLDADAFFVDVFEVHVDPTDENFVIIRDRVIEGDPVRGFRSLVFDLQRMGRLEMGRLDYESEETRATVAEKVRELAGHPGREASPELWFQVGGFAVAAREFDVFEELLDEIQSYHDQAASGVPTHMRSTVPHLIAGSFGDVLEHAPERGDALFNRMIEQGGAIAGGMASASHPMLSMGMRGPVPFVVSSLNQDELSYGDFEFPVPLFSQMLGTNPSDSERAERFRAWFESRAGEEEGWGAHDSGLFYSMWFGGEREEAIERLKAFRRESQGSERANALLMEALITINEYEEAIEVLEEVALRPGESRQDRQLLRISLLRRADRNAEAREELLALAKMPGLDQNFRNFLQMEMSHLGIDPSTVHSRFAPGMGGRMRGSQNPGQRLQQELNNLANEERHDDLERIATGILRRSLPQPADHQERFARQVAANALHRANRAEALESELRKRLREQPGDIETAIRLVEIVPQDSKTGAVEVLTETILKSEDDAGGILLAMQAFDQHGSREQFTGALADLMLANPSHPIFSRIGLEQIANWGADDETQWKFARAVAAMPQEDYARIVLRSRLTGAQFETNWISQLTQAAMNRGEEEVALGVFEKARKQMVGALAGNLDVLLGLINLHMEAARKEEAASLMREIFLADGTQQGWHFGSRIVSGQFLSQLRNLVFQQQHFHSAVRGDSLGQAKQLVEMIDALGLWEEFVALLSPAGGGPVHDEILLLTLRTLRGEDGVSEEWVKQLEAGSPMLRFSNGSEMVFVRLLEPLDEDRTLVPRFFEFWSGVPIPPHNIHSVLQSISSLSELHESYRDVEEVKKYIRRLVDFASGGAQVQHFLHNDQYLGAIQTLMDFGLYPEARRVLDFTKAQRAMPNMHVPPALQRLEAQILLHEAEAPSEIAVSVAVLPEALGDRRFRLHWRLVPALMTGSRSPGSHMRDREVWPESARSVPEGLRPQKIEFRGGANPAVLGVLGEVAGPDSSGVIDVEMPVDLGVLHAVATLHDGSQEHGELMMVAAGPALDASPWVDSDSEGNPLSGYKVGGEDPVGGNTAVEFLLRSGQTQFQVPLAQWESFPENQMFFFEALVGGPQGGNIQFRTEVGGQTRNYSASRSASSLDAGTWGRSSMLLNRGVQTDLRTVSIPDNTRGAAVVLTPRSIRSFGHGQYQVEGKWAMARLVPVEPGNSGEEAMELLQQAWNAEGEEAVALWEQAFRLSPNRVLQHNVSRMVTLFETADQLSRLYEILSEPALLLQNPLATQTPLTSNIIIELARRALEPDAPDAAVAWLETALASELSDHDRFQIELVIWLAKAEASPEEIDTGELLRILGIRESDVQISGNLYVTQAGDAALLLALDRVASADKTEEFLEAIEAAEMKQSHREQFLVIRAGLLASGDPEAALEHFREAISVRQHRNWINGFDNPLLRRIAENHPEPEAVVSAVRSTHSGLHSDEETRRRHIVETLHFLANSDIENKADFLDLWVAEELETLHAAKFRGNDQRTQQLVRLLAQQENWQALQELMEMGTEHPALASNSVQRVFDEYRAMVDLASGRAEKSWPVAWIASENGKKVVRYRWGAKPASFDDTASHLAVLENAPVEEISGQSRVEFRFGEMPGDLRTITSIDGSAAEGEVGIEFPASCGFFRAVAIFDDSEVPGPLVPVVQGRRVFPGEEGLRGMLLGGERGLAPELVSEAGSSPEGSPAYRIGEADGDKRWSYRGPEEKVRHGAVYIHRMWILRSGNRSPDLSVLFEPQEDSEARNLRMVLSQQNDPLDHWTMFWRVVPVLPEHTFWIPYREVGTLLPMFDRLGNGTLIAGWELIDPDENWPYVQWISELAMLRHEAGDEPNSEQVDRMIELAGVEPLTALDYHGGWLMKHAGESGKAATLVPLFQNAFAAEPNPLVPRPKYNRILGALNAGIRSPEADREVQARFFEIGQQAIGRFNASEVFSLHLANVAYARENGDLESALKGPRTEVFAGDGPLAPLDRFLWSAIMSRTFQNGHPSNELYRFLVGLKDDEVIRSVLKLLESEDAHRIREERLAFPRMVFQAHLSEPLNEEEFRGQVDEAFEGIAEARQGSHSLFWTHFLGDALEARGDADALAADVRKRALDWALAETSDSHADQLEILLASSLAAQTLAAQGKSEEAEVVFERLSDRLPELERFLTDHRHNDLVSRSAKGLREAGFKDLPDLWQKPSEED